MIEEFKEYFLNIENIEHREKLIVLFDKIKNKYPNLLPKIAWGTPIFTNNGTYIMGFSSFKEHFSIAPEQVAIIQFADEIEKLGYKMTKGLFKIKWNDKIDYELIYKIIEFNIVDKKDYNKFWR